MRKTLLQMTFCISMLALAACSSAGNVSSSRSVTPTPSSSLSNLYISTNPQSSTPQNAVYALNGANGKLLWNYNSSASAVNSPVVDHGVLYVGSHTSVYALNTQDGKLLWRYPTSAAAEVLGLVIGTVYVGSFTSAVVNTPAESDVYALNASDGSLRWRYKTTDIVFPGIVLDGAIYALASKNNCPCSNTLHYTLALNASDGSVRWKTPAKTDEYSVQLAANGLLFGLGGYPDGPIGILQALNARDGTVKWRFPATPSVSENIIGLDSSAIYALSNDGNFDTNPTVVYALNPTTGAVLWRSEIKGAAQAVATLSGGAIYVGSNDGSVTALNTADGKQMWHVQVGQAGPPIGNGAAVSAVVNGLVYLIFPQGFAALNASDGSLKWRYQASGILDVSTVSNGVVYASSHDIDTTNPGHNNIYALNAADGSLLWRYNAPVDFFAPVVG
jgi:eukaryotic-like serine/threonine-protein kinase